MGVNMNMRGSGEGNINQYLSDTIASVFSEVYTADVKGSTNRELFASNNTRMLDTLKTNTARLSNQDLQNLMQQVADEMHLNASTVSRAVRDKYIQFQTRLIPLRSLFSSPLQGDDGSPVSADAAKQQLRLFIRAEDPGAPLSDEALTAALISAGIHISRRTVAKYRAELNIPSASARKRDGRNRT